MDLEQLLCAIRDGEDGAFKRFVTETRGLLYRYFLERGVAPVCAEDLTHLVLMTVHENVPGSTHPSLRAWFFRVANIKSIDYHRAIARLRETSLSHVHLLMNRGRGLSSRARSEEQRAKLHELLAQMPTALREVAQLDLDSGDAAAFAARKGISSAAVRHRRWRYREWLRKRFPAEFRNF